MEQVQQQFIESMRLELLLRLVAMRDFYLLVKRVSYVLKLDFGHIPLHYVCFYSNVSINNI